MNDYAEPVLDEERIDALLSLSRFDDILDECSSAPLADLLMLGHRLASHNALSQARALYRDLRARPKRPFDWFRLRILIPKIFHGDDRARELAAYRTAVADELASVKHPAGRNHLVQALLCADLALKDYDTFRARAEPFVGHPELPRVLAALVALLPRIKEPRDVAERREKVFVIGLSKTGTKSITQALETMGYTTAHWVNPFTRALIDDDDFLLFDCCSDTPVSFRFEELAGRFANARFILTQRPLEPWMASFRGHYARSHGVGELDAVRRRFDPAGELFHGPLYGRIHDRLYMRYGSLEEAYAAHDERVRDFFSGQARGRLLEFDMFRGDGWPELARFVGRPAPDEPFPWLGKAPGGDAASMG